MTGVQGTFYALGLGPGDPDLMTVRAHTLLQRVLRFALRCVLQVDEATPYRLQASLINPARQHVETLAFPDSGNGWRNHVQRMVALLAHGDLIFLTEGDPLLYNRGAC